MPSQNLSLIGETILLCSIKFSKTPNNHYDDLSNITTLLWEKFRKHSDKSMIYHRTFHLIIIHFGCEAGGKRYPVFDRQISGLTNSLKFYCEDKV